ncbi:MAG: class I SAM-dependent methyltransferase [Gemmatimonadota bacterium]|nr:MAG: class I SAM-dependent methyltransferase [Gemmatimonadota bacterium]
MDLAALGSMPLRTLEPELVDAPVQDLSELADSLEKMSQANRWLGGQRALETHLEPLLRAAPRARLLDVGTGNARTPALLRKWAEQRGCRWSVIGLDPNPQTISVAKGGSSPGPLPLVRGDGLTLPFSEDTFDAVVCMLMIHHFDDGGAVELVREMARVSRGLVLVNDLERTRPNYLGAQLLAETLWRKDRLARYDGPASVRRSFTAEELLAIGREAGLTNVRVRRHFFYRVVLSGGAVDMRSASS